jgi:hypothetical protein
MDDILWTDLNEAEQRAIAVLGAGMSIELCAAAALRTIRRAGLIRGPRLTPKAKRLRKLALLQMKAA